MLSTANVLEIHHRNARQLEVQAKGNVFLRLANLVGSARRCDNTIEEIEIFINISLALLRCVPMWLLDAAGSFDKRMEIKM